MPAALCGGASKAGAGDRATGGGQGDLVGKGEQGWGFRGHCYSAVRAEGVSPGQVAGAKSARGL